ncbi:CorA-like Mg2+ transporter protein [Cyclobacterium xiamenense]|uniref:CorA-like Mg2+ transporter protein n=1 Tax=Cyclobacterium xiamenense TaxID=1297121 RepID=A0A1H7BWG8_9BACT|nr:CorA family divalent cation transporter [Cyclobacterium xiamenense]SEJ81801.1 CorA-like Mg2+ transporter protein [Cyclobacterium xiamenense]
MENSLYSYHVFLFPFKWQHQELDPEADLDAKFNLSDFRKKIGAPWIRKEYKLDSFERFNEFDYFYGHVREILYDLDIDLSDESTQGNKELINHFEYQLPEEECELHYCIQLSDETRFFLRIDSILLNIYSTGTAILSFHLRNFTYRDPGDILKINQFGRRLYPPFYDLESGSAIFGTKDRTKSESALNKTKAYELPDKIWLGAKGTSPNPNSLLVEDFSGYLTIETIKNGPFRIPAFVKGLFEKDFLKEYSSVNKSRGNTIKGKGILIHPILDSRMFVVSWFADDTLINALIAANKGEKSVKKLEEWWYKYVFVDGGSMTCQDQEMREQLLKTATYNRWIDWGTVFGISRYSLVMLTSTGVDSFLIRHLQTMYYKMAELCQVQRATILNYADEVTHVSHLLLEKKQRQRTLEKIATLYKKYLVFINKIYFKEVTAQEQGIEMYDLLQQQMRIPEDVFSLDKQIEELHNYSSFEKNEHNNDLLTKITIIGAIFLPLGFVASLMDWQVLEDDFLSGPGILAPFWMRIGVVIFISVAMVLLMDAVTSFKFNIKNHRYRMLLRVLFYAVFFGLGIYLILSFK